MSINSNGHGGDIYRIASAYGFKENEILDFSANINPLGVPETIKRIINEQINNLVNYPDIKCSDLIAHISRYLKINLKNIIVGNGASEIIYLVLEALKCKRVLLPSPSFSEYKASLKKLNIPFDYFKIMETDDFELNIDKLRSTLENGYDLLFLCNPNNPTSKLINKNVLLSLIAWCKEHGIFVILDEAFIELTIDGNKNSVLDSCLLFDNLFIIRAFTKIYAIPGLRLGYGIGNVELINVMWENKLPWSINTFASMVGSVFEDTYYIEKTQEWLVSELSWFYLKLSKIKNIYIYKPETNFILIKLLSDKFNSASLKESLCKEGILIRDASNFMFLDDSFIRLAIKDRKSNVKFIEIFSKIYN